MSLFTIETWTVPAAALAGALDAVVAAGLDPPPVDAAGVPAQAPSNRTAETTSAPRRKAADRRVLPCINEPSSCAPKR